MKMMIESDEESDEEDQKKTNENNLYLILFNSLNIFWKRK